MPVRAIRAHADVEYDLVIVATLERSAQQLVTELLDNGVPRDKILPLRQEPAPPRKATAADTARSGNGHHA
jgi:hypothetical protein